MTLERQDSKIQERRKLDSLEEKKPQSFKDIKRKQISISKFVVALEKKEEYVGEEVNKSKLSTPVSVRIKRLEEKVRSPGVTRSSRKILKVKDKPGIKIQSMIKKFLISEVVMEERNLGPSRCNKVTMKLGACSRPSLARISRPEKEPQTPKGGKCAREKKWNSTRPLGSLERWLLPGNYKTEGSSVKDRRQREGWRSLLPQGKDGRCKEEDEEGR